MAFNPPWSKYHRRLVLEPDSNFWSPQSTCLSNQIQVQLGKPKDSTVASVSPYVNDLRPPPHCTISAQPLALLSRRQICCERSLRSQITKGRRCFNQRKFLLSGFPVSSELGRHFISSSFAPKGKINIPACATNSSGMCTAHLQRFDLMNPKCRLCKAHFICI